MLLWMNGLMKMKTKVRMIFRVQKEVNPKFKSIWKTKKPYNILKGGRNSFKSSVIALWLVFQMLLYIVKGETANVVVIRKVANTIRDSVFLKMKWALSKFGVLEQFKDTKSPFILRHKKTGSTIYFYGQDDFQKLKSNDIGNLIAVWYEEAAEFDSREDFDQSNATFIRQKHPLAKQVTFFWSYNPPRNPYSWINEWADEMRSNPHYQVHESSYLDDELGFVTEQMIDEINTIKENDYDYYRYLYLGEAVGLGTNVYNMSLFNMIDELPSDDPIVDVAYSADVGHQTSATIVGCFGITAKNNVILMDTYYYSPEGKVRKKAPSELTKEVHEFVRETSKNHRVYKRTIDSAEGGFRNQYSLDYGIMWHGVGKKKKHVMIDYTHDLLAQGRFFVLNQPNNNVFVQQCQRYEWDERTLRSDTPSVIKEDDHAPDCLQYFCTDNLRRLNLKR